jgi:hypothetical protein
MTGEYVLPVPSIAAFGIGYHVTFCNPSEVTSNPKDPADGIGVDIVLMVCTVGSAVR